MTEFAALVERRLREEGVALSHRVLAERISDELGEPYSRFYVQRVLAGEMKIFHFSAPVVRAWAAAIHESPQKCLLKLLPPDTAKLLMEEF